MPIQIDLVILSYAKDETLKALTKQTVDSLLESEDPKEIQFNILVIESNKSLAPFQFENTRTIYPESEFGFHKYLNIGIAAGQHPYVCLCNNDLIFRKGWARAILNVLKSDPTIYSANPLCDQFLPHQNIDDTAPYILANKVNIFTGILTGWCIFTKRELFNKIGLLDEQFNFWYADRDYGKTLLKNKIKHVLVPNAIVTHLGNQSHNTLTEDNIYDELTIQQQIKYENKWGNDRSFLIRFKAKVWRMFLK